MSPTREDPVVTATPATTPNPDAPLATESPDTTFTANHRTAWKILNASTLPVWVAMILFPRSALTAKLVRRIDVVLVGLGVSYIGLLTSGMAGSNTEMPDLNDPASVAAGLGQPNAFLAGWTHYLAFDLLAGRWVWEQSLAAGKTARLPLLLTWWLGPAGVTLHLVRRRGWSQNS